MSLVQEFYLKSEEIMRKNGKNDIRHLKSHIIGGNSDLLYYLVFSITGGEEHKLLRGSSKTKFEHKIWIKLPSSNYCRLYFEG